MSRHDKNPVCCTCGIEYKPKVNSVDLVKLNAAGEAYEVWQVDLLECPVCHARVIEGYGMQPVAIRTAENWREHLALVTQPDHLHFYAVDLLGGKIARQVRQANKKMYAELVGWAAQNDELLEFTEYWRQKHGTKIR